jgi:peptidoglycan/xylan/chitin deacetylase (PgdA/CDA1 family)
MHHMNTNKGKHEQKPGIPNEVPAAPASPAQSAAGQGKKNVTYRRAGAAGQQAPAGAAAQGQAPQARTQAGGQPQPGAAPQGQPTPQQHRPQQATAQGAPQQHRPQAQPQGRPQQARPQSAGRQVPAQGGRPYAQPSQAQARPQAGGRPQAEPVPHQYQPTRYAAAPGSRQNYVSEAQRIDAYNRAQAQAKRKRKRNAKIFASAAAAVAVVAVIYANFFSPITVNVDGTDYSVGRSDTIAQIVANNNIATTPGRLLAVDGSVISADGGDAFSATVNGSDASADSTLAAGDSVQIGTGADETEDYTETTEPIAAQWVDSKERGAFHEAVGSLEDGVMATRTGSISGITAQVVEKEPSNITLERYSVRGETGDDKVIALTFDDGPWHNNQTSDILDILQENGAKATFFVIGENISKISGGADLVQREKDMGMQICSHTYDHAAGSGKGVNLSYMTADEQRDEITKGYEAIRDVTGEEPSHVVRTPGGNYPLSVAQNLYDLIDYEVDWNVDTEDWRRPGKDAIEQKILSVKPGDVILMHDGGGDRSQTVEALREALPQLKAQGYSFVTIDELHDYHVRAQQAAQGDSNSPDNS